jgi:cysteine desulfurase
VEADGLIASLPEIALSSGSACASGRGEPSHVLRAIGRSDASARSALRFGLGRANTRDEIEWVAERLVEAAAKARSRRGVRMSGPAPAP